MRSINGPEIFDMYRWICGGVQKHSRRKSLANPQGHGFIAAMRTKDAGKVSVICARAIVTRRSSSGCRKNFQDVSRKLRKFVQKQHAVVRHADLARTRNRSAAD